MDSITENEHTVVIKAAQLGFTEIILNACGYFIDQDPSPILVIQPNVEPMAQDFSKDRLAPMIRDTPCLRHKIADAKSRDTSNTILNKTFPGGNISITGANSPTGLRSKPKRVVLMDERSAYPASSGTEGDPAKLAIKRAATFWNRRIVEISTPGIKGFCPIERVFEISDKRYYYIPCPHCGEFHRLTWGNVVWQKDKPETAKIECPHCRWTYNNSLKNIAVKKGVWIATQPGKKIAGFHISEIYSSWRTLEELVIDFLEAKDNPELLKVFVNTVLGETWEDAGEVIHANDIEARAENYPAPVPDRAMVLTCGVDVQPDRLECEVVGWGGGEESWSIDYHVIHGDPDIPEGAIGSPWTQLTDYLRKTWKDAFGVEFSIEATCIDTGGANTQAVYKYVKTKRGMRVYGIKGQGGEGLPIVGTPQRKRSGKKTGRPIDLYPVGVDQAKHILYRRLRIKEPGPGYCHFPAGRSADYFRQLVAEKIVTKYVKGFPRREFKKKDGERNEALDVRVYAFAALALRGPIWDKVAMRIKMMRAKLVPVISAEAAKPEPEDPEDETSTEVEDPPEAGPRKRKKRTRRRGGFVQAWR